MSRKMCSSFEASAVNFIILQGRETKGPLNLRMNGHRDDWKHSRFERSPVAEHFRSTEHDFLKHASVCCIDHSPEWTDSTRKSRESYLIRHLNTLRPHGINKND